MGIQVVCKMGVLALLGSSSEEDPKSAKTPNMDTPEYP